MTHDESIRRGLDDLWASPSNAPSPTLSKALLETMMTRIESEKTFVHRVTTIAGLVLAVFTARILYDAFFTPSPFDARREWATVALLILPWIALFAVRWRLTRADERSVDTDATVSDMLAGALRDNAAARWRLKILGLALALGAAFTAVALVQLIETGKMTERNAYQGTLVFGGVLAAVGLSMIVHYARVLRPEARRLQSLLDDCKD